VSPQLPQKIAEQFIRLFNVVFNSAMLYGPTHPTTLKSVAPFLAALQKTLTSIPSVSIVIDRECLFVEEWPVDKVINTRRILQQFAKIGLVSVTFEIGITAQQIETLIRFSADSGTIHPFEQVVQHLQQEGCHSIRLNYVHYGKITQDQTVVGIDEAAGPSASGGTIGSSPAGPAAPSPEVLQQIHEVLNLAHLFEQPQQSSAAFSRTALDPDHADDAVQSITDLRNAVNTGNTPDTDLLLNAVYQLKIDLSEAIELQKETGKLAAAPEPIVDEMESLTCDVIVKLVREEYSNGDVPLRRLAEIIRRMLPEANELKRLLPKLKPALLAAGMSLSDYLQLIRSFNIEFESESLAGSLQEAATGIGATVEELVSAIQSQPDDAARLLVMASEIRKGTQENDAQLSSMLTDYIEKVSTTMALESGSVSDHQGSDVLRQMLEKLQLQLVDNLKKYGVEGPVLAKVGTLLAERRDAAFDKATEQWITREIASSPEVSLQNLSEKLIRMVGEQGQLDRLHDPVMAALTARGFDRNQMEEILKKIATKIASGKMFKLPPGVLSANNMQFLVDRELRQHHRYHTPFSTIMLSLEGMLTSGKARRPTEAEYQLIVPKLFSVAKFILRDIDLVGTLGAPHEKTVFSLLAMTDLKGATIAEGRILKKIASLQLKTAEGETNLITAASLHIPGDDEKPDIRKFLADAFSNHEKVVKEIEANFFGENTGAEETGPTPA
jgi:hypothetical protein